MKTLVVFYSYEGNTRFIAEQIAGAVGADLLEVKPKNEKKRTGLMKYLWGGWQVTSGRQPELLPLEKDPQGYDLLFVGSPVWAGCHTPAMRAFLAGGRLSGKKIALFCCHGGGRGGIFRRMREALSGNEIVGERDFIEPAKRDREGNAQRARAWAKSVAEM